MIDIYHPRPSSELHSMVIEMLPTDRGRVLDAAAGDGNVSRLMAQMGFAVTSADVHFDRPHELPAPIEMDLNERLPFEDRCFDGVVSIETIEHLENPWFFMRELARITRDGGFVIVTSPNVQNAQSRLHMLVDGCLEWFRPKHLRPLGHITPIFDFLLTEMAQRAGLVEDAHRFSRGRVPYMRERVLRGNRLFGECRITRFIKDERPTST